MKYILILLLVTSCTKPFYKQGDFPSVSKDLQKEIAMMNNINVY